MLVTVNLNKLPDSVVDQYKQNLLDAFGDTSRIKVSEDMYCLPELTSEQAGVDDCTGLYPMKFEHGLQNSDAIGELIIVRFPSPLPVVITQPDEPDEADSETHQERLMSYGVCESISDFMLLVSEQLRASKRKFFITFGYSNPGDPLPIRSGHLIRSDHRKPMGENQRHCYFHIHEIVPSAVDILSPMQKSELMMLEISGKEIDAENLMGNFANEIDRA
ncbi:hypothetical protein LMH73_027160 [Vibrio splendidus]|nr:hypothetical protein [Vibrio splendidus]MCC4880486.1 hypothetical protein [Vibrio splendidus]